MHDIVLVSAACRHKGFTVKMGCHLLGIHHSTKHLVSNSVATQVYNAWDFLGRKPSYTSKFILPIQYFSENAELGKPRVKGADGHIQLGAVVRVATIERKFLYGLLWYLVHWYSSCTHWRSRECMLSLVTLYSI